MSSGEKCEHTELTIYHEHCIDHIIIEDANTNGSWKKEPAESKWARNQFVCFWLTVRLHGKLICRTMRCDCFGFFSLARRHMHALSYLWFATLHNREIRNLYEEDVRRAHYSDQRLWNLIQSKPMYHHRMSRSWAIIIMWRISGLNQIWKGHLSGALGDASRSPAWELHT